MKKEYLVLAVVIIGLSLYLVFHKTNQTHYQLPQLPAVEKSNITKIEIVKKDSTITLNKGTNGWTLAPQGFPADSSRVDEMLRTMTNLKLTDLVSESKNYQRYDLNDEKRIQIRAYAGDKLVRNFSIGKAASSYRHTYVKLDEDPNVYHGRENFRSRFDASSDMLRDKSVLSFDTASVKEVAYRKGGQETVLTQKELPAPPTTDAEKSVDGKTENKPAPEPRFEWTDVKGVKAETAKVERLLGTLSNLKAMNFIEGRKKEDFASPIFDIRVKGTEEKSLSIFAKSQAADENYPAVSSQNVYPFTLSSAQAENIMKTFDPPQPAPSQDANPKRPEPKVDVKPPTGIKK